MVSNKEDTQILLLDSFIQDLDIKRNRFNDFLWPHDIKNFQSKFEKYLYLKWTNGISLLMQSFHSLCVGP